MQTRSGEPFPTAQNDGKKMIIKHITDGLTAPLQLFSHHNSIYIVDQVGIVYRITNSTPTIFLDLRDRVVELNPNYDERGLLSIAFDPNNNNILYLFYSTPTDDGYSNVLTRYFLDTRQEQILLEIAKEENIHNGGRMLFGPDGYLYLTVGDGGIGGQGDPLEVAQDLYSLYGKVLRLDVQSSNGYYIPPDNPFIGEGRAEIYAYGFRNPWSMTMDSSGTIFIGDVGFNSYEEIDILEPGGNYGWNIKEGYEFTEWADPEEDEEEFIDPIFAYPELADSSAIIGGYNTPDGFIFGDFSGFLFRIRQVGNEWILVEISELPSNYSLYAFGQVNGTIYALGNRTKGPRGNTGAIFRITVA